MIPIVLFSCVFIRSFLAPGSSSVEEAAPVCSKAVRNQRKDLIDRHAVIAVRLGRPLMPEDGTRGVDRRAIGTAKTASPPV